MFHFSSILVLFLAQMAVGCTLSLALMPLKVVDRKFYQLSCGLSACLLGIALFATWYYPFGLPQKLQVEEAQLGSLPLFTLGAFLLYLGALLWIYFRLRFKKIAHAKALVRIAAFLGALALVLVSLIYRPAVLYGGFKNLLMPIDFISAAMFLGVFMLSMVFGHWYLVQAMPKSLLKRMVEILVIILVVRILVVGSSLGLYRWWLPGGVETLGVLMKVWEGYGIFFWQRVLTGLAVPLVLSYMIWATAKIGANQSATGLLYVGVVFVIIGEIASKCLFVVTGMPI